MAALQDELLNDPLVRGYSAMNDEAAAADLNTEYRERNRTSMSGREIKASVNFSELSGLTDTKKSQFFGWVSRDDLNPFGIDAEIAKDLFGNPSATVTALAAARVEQISRAVELGIPHVKAGHAEEARR